MVRHHLRPRSQRSGRERKQFGAGGGIAPQAPPTTEKKNKRLARILLYRR